MTETMHPGLLPAGLRDTLPPEAALEAAIVEQLVGTLGHHGYERVKPPLVEFEEILLAGSGVAMAPETFRLMDSVSQRMVGIRADMTLQAARIALTRLSKLPRPLRLSYAGEVLRVLGSQMRPERQVGQVGAELIGSDAPEADVEVMAIATEALARIGIAGLSIDLTLPPLIPSVFAAFALGGADAAALRGALDRKDSGFIKRFDHPAAALLEAMLEAAGPAEPALAAMSALQLPEAAAKLWRQLVRTHDLLQQAAPDLIVTLDPVENRGFEYHRGVSFSFYARGMRSALGRGGRYLAGEGRDREEPATGFTLYLDMIMRALPMPAPAPRLFLPYGTTRLRGTAERDQGWITIAGLDDRADQVAEARRLLCSHILGADGPELVDR